VFELANVVMECSNYHKVFNERKRRVRGLWSVEAQWARGTMSVVGLRMAKPIPFMPALVHALA
jgi:hypothetical protein